jgi:hypothetical protein
LKTSFDAVSSALSNGTTFKMFYHADPTNLLYLRRHAFYNMVYDADLKKLFDNELLIP